MSIYEPLIKNREHIRLLTIHADESTRTASFSLSSAFLEDGLEFSALSYVWGDPAKTMSIVVNGVEVAVTTNLAQALARLPEVSGSGLYWIDALCINQADMEERTHQVRLMGKIYSQARLVVAWLGEPDKPESHTAVSVIQELGTLLAPYANAGRIVSDGTMVVPNNHFLDIAEKLESNPYWSRTWIVQEVILGQHVIYVQGKHVLFEDNLDSYLKWVQTVQHYQQTRPFALHPSIRVFMSAGTSSALWLPSLRRLHKLRREKEQYADWREWASRKKLELVTISACLQATDPRDLVYGLLGLCDTMKLRPDYTKTISQVYTDLFSTWLEEFSSLALMEYCGVGLPGGEISYELPSFIPDWNRLSTNRNSVIFDAQHRIPRLGALVARQPGNRHRTLLVQGIPFDVVPSRVDLFKLRLPWTTNDNSGFFNWLSKARLSVYPTGIPRLQALLKMVLQFGQCRDLPPLKSELIHLTVEAFVLMLWLLQPNESESTAIPEKLEAMGLNPDRKYGDEIRRIILGASAACPPYWDKMLAKEAIKSTGSIPSRQLDAVKMLTQIADFPLLFQTQRGYLGIGPEGMQEGDELVILPGLDFPTVLRREGTHYVHVGVCFVVDILDDGMFRGCSDASLELMDFEIR